MRIIFLLMMLAFEISAVDILNFENRYNFTNFNDSVSTKSFDAFATNSGIITSKNGRITEISSTTEKYPIGKVNVLENDGDSVLWLGTQINGIYKMVNSTGEITRTDDFDNIKINSIKRDSNALFIGTNSGLFYFDPQTMISADNSYNTFGIYEDTVTAVKIFQDTIFVKHTGVNCSKAHRKAFLSDAKSWINFVDSANVLFPQKNIVIGDDLKASLSQKKWYTEVWDLVSGDDGVFLGANFDSKEDANIAEISGGDFDNIDSKHFVGEGIQSMYLDRNFLTTIRPSRGVVQYNTATQQESNRFELGSLPGRDLATAISVDGNYMAILNTDYYWPNADDRSALSYDGGLAILDIKTDSSFNILKDTTTFFYNYENPRKFSVSVNKGVIIDEGVNPVKMAKLSDSTYLYALENGAIFCWDTKGTYKNVNDDQIFEIGKLGFGSSPTFFESYKGKVIIGVNNNIAIYNKQLKRSSFAENIIDADFVNDSIVVFLTEHKLSFVNISDISDVISSVALSDFQIGEIPKKVSVHKKEKKIYIVGENSITSVGYFDNFSQEETLTKMPTVYPNPYKRNEEDITIINLLEDSEIIIYTSLGKVVRRLKTPFNQTYLKWDGRNKNGKKIASGVYYIIIKDKERETVKFKLLAL